MSAKEDVFLSESGSILVPLRDPAPRLAVADLLGSLPAGARLFVLGCHFDLGGPWGGVRDLFQEVLPILQSESPDLLARHDYELVHVLPRLKPQLGIRNPSLTDLASHDERVRNYPADRAMRIVHGLIDLLIALKERTGRADERWILLCADFDQAGHISRTFFLELMRRAGSRLRLILAPTTSSGSDLDLPPTSPRRELPFALHLAAPEPPPASGEAARLARELERETPDDVLISTATIPDLIRLWRLAGNPGKTFEWRHKALHAFNTLGLYTDAIRYGEPAREAFRRSGSPSPALRWGIFFKLFMCYLALNDLDSARRLVAEDIPEATGDAKDAAMRIRFCYLMAMLHARVQPVRDFAAGERYLDLGLTYLDQAALPESEHFFQLVFNRNGLAMVRSFQGRFQEALDLCREGSALLDRHLDPGKHRLHRSVLLYNMAQVHTQIGALDTAIEHYSAAMRMDPNYSEYYNERGNLKLKLGRLEEAYQDYQRAIALGPPYFEVWSNLGQCCRVSGRLEEAIAAYDRSLDLQPNQPMVWIVRAQALEGLNRLDEAIAAYGAALELQPTLWPGFAGRAVLLYERGELEECLADLDRAIALAPERPDSYQNRAVALADLGRLQEAARDFQRYLELQPEAADRAEVEARLRDLTHPMTLASAWAASPARVESATVESQPRSEK